MTLTAKPLNDFSNATYVAIDGTNTNSFRRPRQKLWGVFVKTYTPTPAVTADTFNVITTAIKPTWMLVDLTPDFRYGKLKVQEYLKRPPVGYSGYVAGINSVILAEITPADTFVTV